MSFDPKYTVFKTVESKDLKEHTLEGWDLLQVFHETTLQEMGDELLNPFPPPQGYLWNNPNYSHDMSGWKPTIHTSVWRPMRVLKFLLGQTEKKVTAGWKQLKEQLNAYEGSIRTLQMNLESSAKSYKELEEKSKKDSEAKSNAMTHIAELSRELTHSGVATKILEKENLELKVTNANLQRSIEGLEKLIPDPKGPTRVAET